MRACRLARPLGDPLLPQAGDEANLLFVIAVETAVAA